MYNNNQIPTGGGKMYAVTVWCFVTTTNKIAKRKRTRRISYCKSNLLHNVSESEYVYIYIHSPDMPRTPTWYSLTHANQPAKPSQTKMQHKTLYISTCFDHKEIVALAKCSNQSKKNVKITFFYERKHKWKTIQ